jgi:hypothetical protein
VSERSESDGRFTWLCSSAGLWKDRCCVFDDNGKLKCVVGNNWIRCEDTMRLYPCVSSYYSCIRICSVRLTNPLFHKL